MHPQGELIRRQLAGEAEVLRVANCARSALSRRNDDAARRELSVRFARVHVTMARIRALYCIIIPDRAALVLAHLAARATRLLALLQEIP